ncbi:MAG: FtsX-like permease family protein [Elusimicrobiota bacterium]
MNLILKIAWRNILRHKGKSFVIGIILFLGALLMTVGNGIISGMDKGMAQNIVNSFTGDVVIISDKQREDSVLFTQMGRAIEPINNFVDIKKALVQEKCVSTFLPAGRNMAMVLNDAGGDPGYAFVLGVEYDKYQKMFPNSVVVLEGEELGANTRGVLLPTEARKYLYDFSNLWFIPKNTVFNEKSFRDLVKDTKTDIKDVSVRDNIIFMGFSDRNTSMDIRVDVKGVMKYRALNAIFGMFNILDIESYRECQGYFSAADKAVEVSKEKKQLLSMDNTNLDNLFSDDSLIVINTGNVDIAAAKKDATKKEAVSTMPADLETGSYNLVFVKLQPGTALNTGLDKINKLLKSNNLNARAVSWKKAAGVIGSMAALIKGSLFVFVSFLFFVAIIIIVNTLSMAALERTQEIGMMRAVGAKKSFISQMFIGETAILSFVFGGAGILAGIIIVNLIPLFNITSANEMAQLLFGGDKFHPILSFIDIVLTIIQLGFVTFLAVLYPLRVARGITPLDAISRD